MDFEFTYNYRDKTFGLVTSSEHRAIGMCLSQEFGDQILVSNKLEELLVTLEKENDKRVELKEWVIDVEEEEVNFFHHSVCNQDAELEQPDVDNYWDWEVSARCGKDDLIDLVSSWLAFAAEQKG
eukprot:NODE_2243_length_1105_cov_37.604294_g2225_i0.p1 GENE.NODE_2243_length_1105_cov_37.604294_g2225_i0~~NODE_2243_length_1105_cov_37.604294_g2225_i0.p1  ORF type:complete len:125 (-),score=3.79 NODE_2243_length_1105_cov_37.604294_g2225_i0:70-444(-)